MRTEQTSIDRVLAFHSRTKHHVSRFADSPGYLDWATQPDPFRTFAGSERTPLALMETAAGVPYGDLYLPGRISPRQLDLAGIGMMFELALGLTAWKEYGETRWALRSNPSSGNLHPTEGYVVLPAMNGLDAGVFHYVSRDHCLERRRRLGDLAFMPHGTCLVGLSSIHWRESWKYGERAFRYCQHDMGHAIASVRYAAATLGWSATLVGSASDTDVAEVLGLQDSESFAECAPEDREHPGVLLLVGTRSSPEEFDPAILRDEVRGGTWTGKANALSPDHVAWPAIGDAARATWREDSDPPTPTVIAGIPEYAPPPAVDAAVLIRRRRSAVAFDGITSISAATFYGMLDRLLPRVGVPPWDVWPWPPRIHCVIFIHRVDGLTPGLYLFERDSRVDVELRQALRPEFIFEQPDGCPEHLRFYRLAAGDFKGVAQAVSCRQKIAAAGAFSLGMLAELASGVRSKGAWWYRRLFWEAGLLGQVLYLEAEAAGIRGTGIGCYFDDAFHNLLGIEDLEFQSLYHFTIGGPVEDARLMTRPGYTHLRSDSELD